MFKNSASIMFFITLASGVMITISSNSWLGAWMGLEINLLSFIPILMNNNNVFTTEAALKYFLIQALASSSFLFFILMEILFKKITLNSNDFMITLLISSPLMMKSGIAPLHWWFPSVMEGLNWMNCLIMMTLQKIAPIILLSLLLNNILMNLISLTSILFGSIGGMNQLSIRKIMTYSSINHIGWMMSALMIGENLWIFYFTIYSMMSITFISAIKLLNISFINQISMLNNNLWTPKFMIFSLLLSLGGLPPFLGFLPKWIIIQILINNCMTFQATFMVVLSLITLYYYLRMCYSSFMILHSEPSWNMLTKMNNTPLNYSWLLLTSLLGLLLTPITIMFM
uniref:NADH dehydrogenase subunit 2 n=1 Tax=Margattea multipunctata TaxID=1928782 RepID=UPI00279DAC4E|nr:NADH dehydrogenase subunit 2 [Margattea multipunctata]WGO57301.1 NADH dehydrogenase subunit 2 [Margattea multipunctata]